MATDFSSLDKMVEFGLGLGIATQMMNTMNLALARTAVPGVGINPGVCSQPGAQAPAAVPAGHQYYIVNQEKVAGPLNERELDELIKKGIVKADTLCWSPGMTAWKFASDIPEVNKLILLNG